MLTEDSPIDPVLDLESAPIAASKQKQDSIVKTISLKALSICLLFFLAFIFLAFGVANTIAAKLADEQKVPTAPHRDPVKFEHPLFQCAAMFLGEFLCYLAYTVTFTGSFIMRKLRPKKEGDVFAPLLEEEADAGLLAGDDAPQPEVVGPTDSGDMLGDELPVEPETKEVAEAKPNLPFWKSFFFFFPAIFDMLGTSTMYVGLVFTYTSVYQMLRAFLVVFTFILSTVVLRRRPTLQAFTGVVLIMVGTLVVGYISIQTGDEGTEDRAAKNPMLGNILVIAAQLFPAMQFIIEELVISKYSVSGLRAVGLEGFTGLILTGLALPIAYFIPVPKAFMESGQLENALEAFYQIAQSPALIFSISLSILSIAGFNVAGITITKRMSAGARATIDSCRTLFIWLISMALGWEDFHILMVFGFLILVWGTLMYNKVLPGPWQSVKPFAKPIIRGIKRGREPEAQKVEEIAYPEVGDFDFVSQDAL
ncbi:Solute carrier family 35 member SLC35F1/F2/F6 [Carpediemonas membranifera]|uniref:Solute carrier family 35 member SLC35F1/F2/F6 n=1 Tax=Carpediemonas membranifera TaxID=201153 RepID=A0A8J6B9N4_9EUKA|nr:Solute carrier family 35 member SLC35F1/F2/F6 [Carpediemonas membranifera]|eukprot:KAG9392847.1 Solute carrier family 35 member SLC35F1/F2/F6 [Carpediemonas membranifera]